MYLKTFQIASAAADKGIADIAALVDPITLGKATSCEIQATGQNVMYTMSGDAPTTTNGLAFLTTEGPRSFLIDDLRRMRFINGGGGSGNLNIALIAGRDI